VGRQSPHYLQKGERRLAAIVFTDLEGYTALAQRDESRALELLDKHRELVRPIFARFGGREVKTMGDAFLLEFNSALEAVQCAIEVQKSQREYNERTHQNLLLRIGIHVGDVVHREGDLYGDAVNIASRIEPLAEGGDICISEQVYDQVRNKVPYPLVRLESPDLKNVTFQVDIYKVQLPWNKTSPLTPHEKPFTKVFRKQPVEAQESERIGELILRLTLKKMITDVEVLNEPQISSALAKFSQTVDYSGGETLCIVSGIHTVRVVIDSKNIDNLKGALPKRNVLGVVDGLAEVIVTLSEAALRTRGVIARMSTELAKNRINILEYIHATPNVIIVVDEEDATRTYQVLEALASDKHVEPFSN
jgi:adenylate cyclase